LNAFNPSGMYIVVQCKTFVKSYVEAMSLNIPVIKETGSKLLQKISLLNKGVKVYVRSNGQIIRFCQIRKRIL
jgi:hypothetical protein